MPRVLKYKTIQSSDKGEFDLIVTRHLEIGWNLVDSGYTYSNGLHIREIIYQENENIDLIVDNNGKMSRGHFNEDGIKDGVWTYWHDNGQKETEDNYRVGKKNGKWSYLDKNGRKWKEGYYRNGKQDGLWMWYKDGKKRTEILFRDGNKIND